MVSVVCGHSVCVVCVNGGERSRFAPGAEGWQSASSSSSGEGDDDGREPEGRRCPICNAALTHFVKNYEAVTALEAAARKAGTAGAKKGAGDLKSVVDVDLVLERDRLTFQRSPGDELGAGGSGVVYKGLYDGKVPVAVKCIRSTSDSWTTAERLRRELKLASRLNDPHIVQFRGAAWDDEAAPGVPRNVLLVTELMGGGNLRSALNAIAPDGIMAVEFFLTLAIHVAKGLEYLHAEGMAHRDIKSANILLSHAPLPNSNRFPSGVRAKIADFGLSKYIDKVTGGGTVVQSIMEPGRLEATYAYLAPEAFGGDKTNVIRRSDDSDDEERGRYDEMAKKRDIYALGVLFWEMLTGKVPWAGVSLPDVYVRVCVRSDRPYPGLEDLKVSRSLRRLVERCWAQNPTRRPSATSIVDKLEKIMARMPAHERVGTTEAAEAISVVSSQAPQAPADLNTEPLLQQQQQQTPAMYRGMPSGSTVRTTQNDGFEESGDGDGMYDDVPGVDDIVGEDPPQRLPTSTAAPVTPTIKRQTRPVRHHLPVSEEPHSGMRSGGGGGSGAQATSTSGPGSATGGQRRNATAVAATAAAIAAAKDRERKRDDVRGGARVSARGATRGGDASFPSLPSGFGRERSEQPVRNGYFTEDGLSDEDFDPERAAADEAVAAAQAAAAAAATASAGASGTAATNNAMGSNSSVLPALPRNLSASRGSNRTPASAKLSRSISTGPVRVSTRPSSPVVRHVSPATRGSLPAPPVAGLASFDEMPSTRSLGRKSLRNSDGSAPAVSKKSSFRGSGHGSRNIERSPSHSSQGGNDTGKSDGRQVNNALPLAAGASASGAQGTGTVDSMGRRAFIRRLRSVESPGRMGRSVSSNGSAAAAFGNSSPAAGQSSRSKSKNAVVSGADDIGKAEETTVVVIGAPPKDDYLAIVRGMEKDEVLRTLAQRAHPLRLAGLAHATLVCKKHSFDEEVLRNACAILHRLTVPSGAAETKNDVKEVSAKEQLSIRKYLKSNDGVHAMLHALRPPGERHPTTLSYAMLALGNLTAWDLDAHKQFRDSDGVPLLVEVMELHGRNMGVLEKGCYALACVAAAYPSKSKVVFKNAGAVDVVVGALSSARNQPSQDAVTKQACAALGAMCSGCPENAVHAGQAGAIAYLISAFDGFRRTSRVDGGKRSEMRLVCKAFMDLMCHADNRKLAGSQGGTPMIIRAMRIFRLDAEFIEKGLATLSDFCAYRTNGTQIVQANGVDDIVAAMVRFRMSLPMQREGSRTLTLLMKATGDHARRRLVHAGGGEAIVFALERFGAIEETNASVTVEACRALAMLFNMESPSEGEILGRRMKKIRCDRAIKNALVAHKSNQAVQDKGRDALKQLNNLKAGGGLWNRMRMSKKK